MPQFGATFTPGGVDDYYMPEVVAPAPQRVMPEVPANMQQGLHRMELEARSADPKNRSGPTSPALYQTTTNNGRSGTFSPPSQHPLQPGQYSPASAQSPFSGSPGFDTKRGNMDSQPNFSYFPQVSGEHIPPSDDEKEAVLAESRLHVLHSNDPDMQIIWARDVLAFVEISAENTLRELEATRAPGDRDLSRPTTPKTEHELRVDATNIVSYLADQGHPEATFIRSKWLEFGKFGKRQDKKEAYSGYSMAAQQGWGRADYRIGMLYENSNDMDKALRHYHMGLQSGDSAASYRLGMISLMGQRGQPKDLGRGLEMIRSAADTADEDAPQGAFVYGMLISRDLPDVSLPEGSLPYDVALAKQYIEKAAYLGFAKAQLKMGQAYELCQIGCDFNPALSLHYYGLAAKQGQPEACLGVSRWFLFGYESTFQKNEQLAFKYAQLAAKTKLPTGEFAMGYYYEIGISVDKDVREARKWYELAAEHGNKDAVERIQGLAEAKTLSKQDHETTALTRIKSKHGSQRGQRPARFQQQQQQQQQNKSHMPTLSEDQSPGASPLPSPRPNASFDQAGSGMPEPSQHTGNGRQAFALNLPDRSRSAAPYPEDDRPTPAGLASRPKSTAPYPEDDMAGVKPPMGSRFSPNPNMRPPVGPGADRANSAFGVRTGSPSGGQQGLGIRPSQSAGNLPIPPAGVDPNRGRPASANWPSQPGGPPPAGYPQSGVSPSRRPDMRPATSQFDQHPGMGGPPPAGYEPRMSSGPGPRPNPNPNASRLQKTNPNPYPPRQGPAANGLPMGGPGGPGPRPSPRPSSGPNDPYGRGSGAPHPGPGPGSPAMSGGLGPRTDSGFSSGGGGGRGGPGGPPNGGRQGVQLTDRPMPSDSMGPGRASAPPAGAGSSPAPSSTGSSGGPGRPPKPSAPAKVNSGPATFEEMGIPQVKKNDDCVVM